MDNLLSIKPLCDEDIDFVTEISRKEGFSIPGIASAKNYSKLHLGNAKPTLLKFK